MKSIRKRSQGRFEDSDVLKGISDGDHVMISHLYREHYPNVERLVTANSGSVDQAKDIFQETVLVLYDKVKDQGLSLDCRLKTFIYAISRNLWLKSLNRMEKNHFSIEREEIEELQANDEDFDLHAEQEIRFEKMDCALQMLGEPCRSILKAFYIQNKSMQEISSDYGYTSADNAKTQKYKCLQRLKKLFFDNRI